MNVAKYYQRTKQRSITTDIPAELPAVVGVRDYLTQVVLNLVLNATLIPVWGMPGAATATALSMIAWAATMTVAIRRRLGLSMSVFARPTAGVR